MLFSRLLSALSIRYKIFLTCMVVLIPFALITGLVSYSVMRESLERHIISELTNTTEVVRTMVETSVRLSVRNYLRSAAESNRDVVALIYEKQLAGQLTERAARQRAAESILSQRIGQTGYLYCVTSQGRAPVHPVPEVVGVDFSDQPFVAEQMRRKEGYLEYEWRNPGEEVSRAKALYMTYFEPWDWIISATAYKDEFEALVNVEDFRQSVESLRFGKSGYSFVLDLQGNMIMHPLLQGESAFQFAFSDEGTFVNTMIGDRRGQQTYYWQNPGEPAPRKKIVVYDFVPEAGWIVASSAYLDDLYAPLEVIRDRVLVAGMFCLLIGVVAAMRVSSSITNPISQLVLKLSKRIPGEDFKGRDEVGQLSTHFDHFLLDLEQEARERFGVEQKLRASQERYRAVMEAAPDPIMVLGLKGEVTYLNKAFQRVFGWTLEDFSAERVPPFLIPEERVRSRYLMGRLLKGEVIAGEESMRVTRGGNELTVNMSGGPFLDSDGKVGGCVVILRDVSELKLLEREVIDADERERIRIGQDLHDDLVPHLIGLDVMYKLLRRRLDDGVPQAQQQAAKVQDVISEAITKTRALSRGLSPVHLVEEGLEMSVRQLGEMVETVFGIPCTVKWQGAVSLDTTTAVHVYRIIQEALHNAVKHAKAKQLLVECSVAGDRANFQVTDDGLGLSSSDDRKEGSDRRGMGLKIMAFRAQIIGGNVKVSATSGGGTQVTLTVRQES